MNKQDFIEKYHKVKTLKFEPPTFEEFMKTKTDKRCAHWECGDIDIIMLEENYKSGVLHCSNQIIVDAPNVYDAERSFNYYNEYGVDTREETYYQALKYAVNLFLEK